MLGLLHISVSKGGAQGLALAGRFGEFGMLIAMWIAIAPLLALIYAFQAKKMSRSDLALIVALGSVWSVTLGLGVFQFYGYHDARWVNTDEIVRGTDVLALSIYLLGALVYYAFLSISEELFFRSVLFELLQAWRIKAGTALVFITATLFGAAHLANYRQFLFLGDAWGVSLVLHVFSVTLMGVVFGVVYLRRRNLLLVSFLHWWVWVANILARVVAGATYLYLS